MDRRGRDRCERRGDQRVPGPRRPGRRGLRRRPAAPADHGGAPDRQAQTTPVVFTGDGARHLVFGSDGGIDHHPDRYLDIRVPPQVTVEVPAPEGHPGPVVLVAARAEARAGTEREHRFALQCAKDPAFAGYRVRTERLIPVVALVPLDLSGAPGRARVGTTPTRVPDSTESAPHSTGPPHPRSTRSRDCSPNT
ncbi:nitroreductase/quinone reductase family protein [Actinokineospora auranticolor]|nr:nitroreductase/quinone reductase family protein [Actinokineospora auranticolor]